MVVPPSELNRVRLLVQKYTNIIFIPSAEDHELLIRVGNADPTALDEVVSVLVEKLNAGLISPPWDTGTVRWLNDFAKISEHLRDKIASVISMDLIEFWCGEFAQPGLRKAAEELSDTLKLERPRHYFDLSRKILTSGGSILIIGAGFSYESYAPLLREMEGIACGTLYDLGVADPRSLYHTKEQQAWEIISRGWQIFQKHVSFTLLPKEPSEQHVILAELFYAKHITHIVSFNWDDLIEKAYKKLYNEDIPMISREGQRSAHALWKLHGDINDSEERWVLPFEEGRVFASLVEITEHTTLPAIIIGYRELESAVRDKLLNVLDNRGGITRIRPDLTNNPPVSFSDDALSAMRKIRAGLESAKKSSYPT